MPGKLWSDEEKMLLQDHVANNTPHEHITIPGRSSHAIAAQLNRMELKEKRVTRAKWSRRQLQLLRKLKGEDLTPKEIHEFDLLGMPYRSIWAIRKQWGRKKLSDQKRAQRMRDRKRWQPGEKRKFVAYLQQHSATQTPEEIGDTWGMSRSTVARWQHLLGIKQPREQVLKMSYSRQKQERARRASARRNRKRWAAARTQQEENLLAQAEALIARRPSMEQKVCSTCQRSWPKRPAFFHTREKLTSFGTSRYYKGRCRLCENQRLRTQQAKKRTTADSFPK